VNVRPAVKEVLRAVVEDPIDLESDPFPSISEGARDLLSRLLDRNPKTRLTAFEALDHPWVREGGNAPDAALDGDFPAQPSRALLPRGAKNSSASASGKLNCDLLQ
ncbi:Calcium-dependent protein kinase 25, partial [Cymbomonas tetramitiformis]